MMVVQFFSSLLFTSILFVCLVNVFPDKLFKPKETFCQKYTERGKFDKEKCVEVEYGVGIGDQVASQTSSRQFFDNIDENGDGRIVQDEIREFVGELHLEDSFGTRELEREMKLAFETLDADDDQSLSQKEGQRFWASLGSLLSVQEVAEWVVHGLGLPEDVGDAFLVNGVSGYDFAELVADGGAALEEELGITKSTYRSRILRAIQLRMLDIGDPPGVPKLEIAETMGPTKVILQWGSQSQSTDFPIHKYRLQRRTHSREAESEWLTVLDGLSMMYTDSRLEPNTLYTYRLQAWNFIGHSQFVYVNVKTLPESYNLKATFEQLQVAFGWLMWMLQGSASLFHIFIAAFTLLMWHVKLSRLRGPRPTDMEPKKDGWILSLLNYLVSKYLAWMLPTRHLASLQPCATAPTHSMQQLQYAEPIEQQGFVGRGPLRHEYTQINSFESISTFDSQRNSSRCYYCNKKFSKKLWKHRCLECRNIFCHRHGLRKHFRFFKCRGKCICNECSSQNLNQGPH